MDADTKRAMIALCRWLPRYSGGITGYAIPRTVDSLALVQHYVGCSPVIDLTATPEVALYFALLKAQPGSTCVVYALDQHQLHDERSVEVSDHAFLVLPLGEGGLRHRWLRQDGYSVSSVPWYMTFDEFDLLKLPSVHRFTFSPAGQNDADLVADLGNLEDPQDDPLPRAVRRVLSLMANVLGVADVPGVQRLLNLPGTRDPWEELLAEIDVLIRVAEESSAPDVLDALHEYRRRASSRRWDTSLDAALDWARSQLKPGLT